MEDLDAKRPPETTDNVTNWPDSDDRGSRCPVATPSHAQDVLPSFARTAYVTRFAARYRPTAGDHRDGHSRSEFDPEPAIQASFRLTARAGQPYDGSR